MVGSPISWPGPLPVVWSIPWAGLLPVASLGSSLVLFLGLVACSPEPSPPEPLNLLLVSIDTLRADHLSCYGYDGPSTPVLDGLAAEGQRFAYAIAAVPTTLPSHAAMLTGRHPHELGVLRNGLVVPDEVTTLAEHLSAWGWSTGAFVSAVPLDPSCGLDQGFDTYESTYDAGARPGKRHGRARRTVELASDWLAGHDQGPFFLMVHLFDPHAPYAPPDPLRIEWKVPAGRQPRHTGFVPPGTDLAGDWLTTGRRAYAAEIAGADAALGRLVESLRQRGLLERTVIVVLSDHGESLDELAQREGYAFDHGEYLYAHQLRVPLIMRLPDSLREAAASAGHVVDAPVSLVDLSPTLLDLLDLTDGGERSWRPLLEGRRVPARPAFSRRRSFQTPARPFLAEPARSVVYGRWHLMATGDGQPALYDLQADPHEVHDLAARHPDVVAELQAAWERFERESEAGAAAADVLDPELDAELRALGYTR